jgi:putative transposase
MVDYARSTWRVSIRRACRALPVERSTYHYRSRRAGQAQLTERIKEVAATRVRYGHRRIHVLLRRDGWRVNAKRVYRLYRDMGLQLRHKTPKRRVKAKLREDRRPATRSNETWAMDFVHDQLATGTKLRVLTIIDTFSRFSPPIEPRFNFRGADVVEVLERVGREVGLPCGGAASSERRLFVSCSFALGAACIDFDCRPIPNIECSVGRIGPAQEVCKIERYVSYKFVGKIDFVINRWR